MSRSRRDKKWKERHKKSQTNEVIIKFIKTELDDVEKDVEKRLMEVEK
jgi:hypothetical protein